LNKNGIISNEEFIKYNEIREIRNKVVHGLINPEDIIDTAKIEFIKSLTKKILENKNKWNPY